MIAMSLFAALVAIGSPSAEPSVVPAAAVTPVTTTPRIKRYCIKDRREGVTPGPKICRTREDWRARGFDPVVVLGRQ